MAIFMKALAFNVRHYAKKPMVSTVPGFSLFCLDSSTRPAELNVRPLDALVAGMQRIILATLASRGKAFDCDSQKT